MKNTSEKSKEFFELFIETRKEIATETGYRLEEAIRLTFDKFKKNTFNITEEVRCEERIKHISTKFIEWLMKNYNEHDADKWRYKWHTDMNFYTIDALYVKFRAVAPTCP